MFQNYGSIRIKKIVNESSDKMLKHLVHHFATNNEVKADAVKQFNSTLKSGAHRYFTTHNTSCYMDVLAVFMYQS